MLAHDLPHGRPRKLTRTEYERMGELQFFRGERVELVHGIVVRMSPIGPTHSSIVGRLGEILIPHLLGRATVRIQQPLIAADDSEPEPDVAVVPHGRYADHHPDSALLVVEVAESSLAYDRETKGPLYAASGVLEYWIVDVAGGALEVHRGAEAGRYAEVVRAGMNETATPRAFPDLSVAVREIFG